ncbi:MAG: AAA family ATPase [Halieaceae bacterium]|jgi:MoxR-like ATPase|nr:AAA family ATPase [Halieaceae bacterium]
MQVKAVVDEAVEQISRVLLGKDTSVRLSLACLIAGGHLLLEDLPGMGKTTLSHALASVMGLKYSRVQFTSDLLPADILGVSVFDRESGAFQFREGPVFTQLLLADEINRATPRTQSALLEAMAEGQVSIDGVTRPLPEPFFVIATQNPVNQSGTYPLPESQLDRFLMRLSLGYPDPGAERLLLTGARAELESIGTCLPVEQLLALRKAVSAVSASDSLVDYVQRLVAYTREAPEFALGLSPRGSIALLNAARAWACMAGRSHVVPEDIQVVMQGVVAHRVMPSPAFGGDGDALVQLMRKQVDVVAG